VAEQSLRDTISEAVSTVETAPVETPVETPAEPTETLAEARARDEKGRFAPKVEAAPEAPPEAPTAPVEVAPERKPPSSWKKDYWDDWKTLPQKVQDYIEQREGEALRGVTTYKQQAESAKEIQTALMPYQQMLTQSYGSVTNGLQELFKLSDFASQNPQGFITWFAQNRGIDLNQLSQAAPVQALPEYVQLQQQVLGLQNQLRTFQQQTTSTQEQAIQAEIQRWSEGKEHLEAVREDMAALLQTGRAQGLDDAYNKALRLNEELWTQLEAKQRQEKESQKLQEAAELAKTAKTAAVQVKGAPANTAAVGTPSGGLRSHLESAFNSTRV